MRRFALLLATTCAFGATASTAAAQDLPNAPVCQGVEGCAKYLSDRYLEAVALDPEFSPLVNCVAGVVRAVGGAIDGHPQPYHCG